MSKKKHRDTSRSTSKGQPAEESFPEPPVTLTQSVPRHPWLLLLSAVLLVGWMLALVALAIFG